MNNRFIIFTKIGLIEFSEFLTNRKTNYYKNKKLPREFEVKNELKNYEYNFDVKKPLSIQTPALRGSIRKIIMDQLHPEILENELIEKDENEKLRIKKTKEEQKRKNLEAQYTDNNAMVKRRLQEKKLKRMLALKEQRRNKLKVQKAAKIAKLNK